jgi:hypothetical protein
MPDVNRLLVQPNLPMRKARICGILIQNLKRCAIVDVVDILTLRSHSNESQEHEERERNKFAPHPAPLRLMVGSTCNLAVSTETKKEQKVFCSRSSRILRRRYGAGWLC